MLRHYVVFVHGVGEQTPLNPTAFFARIRRACERELARLGVRGRIRRFLIGHMGDVVAYAKLPYPPDKYGEIHERFAQSLARASHAVEQAGSPSADLTVIAHSLGTVIASDGIYTLQKTGAFPANLRLANVFTFGSPIALFGLRYGLERFTKPIRPKVWINFSYPQDIIGYHLKPLNPAYAEAVTDEVLLLPGESATPLVSLIRMFTARLPGVGAMLSHAWYFADPHVIGRIAQTLAGSLTETPCKSA